MGRIFFGRGFHIGNCCGIMMSIYCRWSIRMAFRSANLAPEGIIDPVLRQELQEKIATQREARRWKGNAKGVDLNRIFTEEALDQPESIVLRDLVNAVSPQLTINYHSTGQVIFLPTVFYGIRIHEQTHRISPCVRDRKARWIIWRLSDRAG